MHYLVGTMPTNQATIAVTGSPGAGKTTISKSICEKTGLEYFCLKTWIMEKKLYDRYDEHMDTYIVDVEKLSKKYRKLGLTNVVLDGHLSHKLNPSHIILVRCMPTELSRRLFERGYGRQKILDNVEAEFMGVLEEEVTGFPNLIELDNTSSIETETILGFIREGGRHPLNIEWSADFEEFLTKISPENP